MDLSNLDLDKKKKELAIPQLQIPHMKFKNTNIILQGKY